MSRINLPKLTKLLRQELAEQRALGNVCEAGGVFLHDLGNSLNVLLFELALLERKAPEEQRASLLGLRDVGRDIAQKMQDLRQYEDSQRTALYAVDVNEVIRTAVAEGLLSADSVELALEVDLPAVLGTVSDLQRLMQLLAALAVAMPKARLPISVQTQRSEEWVQMRVGWAGPKSGKTLPTLPPGTEAGMTWSVCQRLVRRLRGPMRLESQPGGGGAFCVELTVAEPS